MVITLIQIGLVFWCVACLFGIIGTIWSCLFLRNFMRNCEKEKEA